LAARQAEDAPAPEGIDGASDLLMGEAHMKIDAVLQSNNGTAVGGRDARPDRPPEDVEAGLLALRTVEAAQRLSALGRRVTLAELG
jgi:hypothetical protein